MLAAFSDYKNRTPSTAVIQRAPKNRVEDAKRSVPGSGFGAASNDHVVGHGVPQCSWMYGKN